MKRFLLAALLVCASCTAAPDATTGAADEPPTPPPAAAPDDAAPFYAPDFTADTLDGGQITLSNLRGRWVVLNFWATWCAPCVEEMPALQQIADDYADTLTLLGVNMRETPQEVAAFIEAQAIRYPILINPGDQMLLDYTVTGLPQTFIIDPAGEIVYRSFGAITLDSFATLLDTFIGV